MATAIFEIEKVIFEAKALKWVQQFAEVCYLQSNGYVDEYGAIEAILAVDAIDTFESDDSATFQKLEIFKAKHPDSWMFGFFGYDLKNEIENLSTSFPNPLGFPNAYFFIPQILIRFTSTVVEIRASDPHAVYTEIVSTEIDEHNPLPTFEGHVQKRMSKPEYLEAFSKLKTHIQRGDIYEVNLCQEFYAEGATIDPLLTYRELNRVSPTPFSTFFKIRDRYILSASPERFLAKRGETLVSQPIKGTAPRGRSPEEDSRIIKELRNNPKEIAENVMIVDLVRNDMTRSAKPGTVAAENKLEVKSYQQVHQLVSTVTCTKNPCISDIEAIKNIFPPGSMTGAPKISAMRLCDSYEASRRGVYSGTVGYFAPNGDFDFNVIIRTILYNKTQKYLSFHTGGAITYSAEAEKEYAECLLKAGAILKTLGAELL
jgi:para-aminobenzoate synthetase component 1